MTKANLTFSSSAEALLHRPFAGLGHVLDHLWHGLTRHWTQAYHPERYYMRGPGPAWRAKHGPFPSA